MVHFNDISFGEERATFLRIFSFPITTNEPYEVKDGDIFFPRLNEKKAEKLVDKMLLAGFNNLKNNLSGNTTVYVHRNSGIPLLGSNSFGLVDRDTNLIEIKPITSCNLNCIFCSVDEGLDTSKKMEFVVEKDYLVEEFKKLAEFKDVKPLYAYINVHGEPMLYEPMVELIRDLKKIPNVITGIITNGTLLSKSKIDALKKAGLDRINISLNAFSKEKADHMAGTQYNIEYMKKIIEYANEKLETVVAPVYVKGHNEDEMEDIIKYIISIRKNGFPLLGIQNFLRYKLGRNPAKQVPWEDFKVLLDSWEKKYKINLMDDNFYEIFETKKLEKPFKKNDVVKAHVFSPDRFPGQSLAYANGRVISILERAKGSVTVKIVRDKHNIFTGVLV